MTTTTEDLGHTGEILTEEAHKRFVERICSTVGMSCADCPKRNNCEPEGGDYDEQ